MELVRTADLWFIQMVVNVGSVQLCILFFLTNVKMWHISEQVPWVRQSRNRGQYLRFSPFPLSSFPLPWYTYILGKINSRKTSEAGAVEKGGEGWQRGATGIFSVGVQTQSPKQRALWVQLWSNKHGHMVLSKLLFSVWLVHHLRKGLHITSVLWPGLSVWGGSGGDFHWECCH